VFAGTPSIVVWAWPETISSWASNGFNRTSLALGVGGRFPEFERDRLPTHSRLVDFEAGLQGALAMVAEELPNLMLVTHRQAARDRRADPGEALAQVAVRAAGELGLRLDLQVTTGTGRPCPLLWSSPGPAAATISARARGYTGPLGVPVP